MSPDPPIGRRRSGCGARRAEGGDEHVKERIRRCVTERAQETTPGSAASAPEMQVRLGGFGLSPNPALRIWTGSYSLSVGLGRLLGGYLFEVFLDEHLGLRGEEGGFFGDDTSLDLRP